MIAPPVTYWPQDEKVAPSVKPPNIAQTVRNWHNAVHRWKDKYRNSLNKTGYAEAYNMLYGIAQTHWRTLAADNRQPDIPLLELRQLASATAICHWKMNEQGNGWEEGELALLALDMSGIQKYLFGIADVGVGGGIARSLRARSFLLTQIVTLFAWHLTDVLDLRPSNILLDAGGKFYLLIPNTQSMQVKIDEVRQEAAHWCLQKMNGEIALNIACSAFSQDELRDGAFGAIWQSVHAVMAKCKRQQLAGAI